MARNLVRNRTTRFAVPLALVGTLVLALALLAGVGTAASSVAPKNTSAPSLSGTPEVGNTLTANHGTFSGTAPITYTYRYGRCDKNGDACFFTGSTTQNTFKLTADDVGHTIRVRVTATNTDGSDSATSAPSPVIKKAASSAAPKNTSAPSLSGTPEVGNTLTANHGTFSGTAPITYTYRYGRCDKNGDACFFTGSTTQNTFKLTADDVGHTIRVRVTATNTDGSDSATSAPSPVIKKASGGGGGPTAKGCPSGNGPVTVAQTTVPARLNVDRFTVNPDPVGGSTQSIQVTIHVSNTCGQSVSGATVQVLAVPFNQFSNPAEAPTDGNGNVTVTMNRLSGYPAARRQSLLVLFVRARKAGDPILAGISTRRLVSVGVDLGR